VQELELHSMDHNAEKITVVLITGATQGEQLTISREIANLTIISSRAQELVEV
jgi:hypothetical protein